MGREGGGNGDFITEPTAIIKDHRYTSNVHIEGSNNRK